MLEITKISDRVIEVGIDPICNSDYEDCYATRFSVGEVKAMLVCLGLDYDKNQELVTEQAEIIKQMELLLANRAERVCTVNKQKEKQSEQVTLLQEAIEGALRISDLWIPSHVDAEHQGEAEALHVMRNKFIEALSVTKSNHE